MILFQKSGGLADQTSMESARKLGPSSCIFDLDWESQFWNLRMGQLRTEDTSRKEFLEQSKKYEFVQTEINIISHSALHTLVELGFKVVECRVHMSTTFKNNILRPTEKNVRFGKAEAKDTKSIVDLFTKCNTTGRFSTDPNFYQRKVSSFYHQWIEKSVAGELDNEVMVLWQNDVPIAYCTLKYRNGYAEIGYIGVAPELRGRGYASMFVFNLLDYLRSSGMGGCQARLQADNPSMIKTFEKANFRTEEISMILHWWNQLTPR